MKQTSNTFLDNAHAALQAALAAPSLYDDALAQLAAAGLPVPAVSQKLDGRSFAAVIRNPAATTKEAVFQVYPRSRPGDGAILGRSVRTDRHRLVEWKKPGAAPATAVWRAQQNWLRSPAAQKLTPGMRAALAGAWIADIAGWKP